MRRTHRISSLVALVAYLFSGGWAAGSYWMRCEGADGSVRIETRFTMCCTDDPSHEGHESHPDHGASAVLDETGCGPCVDTPLIGAFVHLAKDRQVKQALAEELLPPASFSSSTDHVLSLRGTPFSAPAPSERGESAHSSVATVVLRC